MSDLISRQAAIDALRTCYDTETITMDNGDEYINYGDAVGEIEQLPLIQPKRGRWEMRMDERFVECSECGLMTTRNELRGLAVLGKNEPNFCPNCGADMREVTT